MDYNVITADTHMDVTWLPGDMFVKGAPDALKDKMPYVNNKNGKAQWEIEGEFMCWVGGGGLTGAFGGYVAGESKHLDRMAEVGFFDGIKDGIYHPSNADLRVKDLDIDGLDAEVIYGILGIGGGGFSGPGFKDPEVTATIYDVYNEWIAEFTSTNPGRMKGLACLASHDPARAAQQLRRAGELGLRGAEINVGTMVKPVYHKDWDPLWATSAEYQMPISFHTLGVPHRKPDDADKEAYHWLSVCLNYTLFQLSGAEFLCSIVLSGACERYSDFNFVLGECGIGWIPYVIERTDEEYDDRGFHMGYPMKPSEYWRRQGHSTFQNEYVSVDQIERIGLDNIMWGNDYPHPDGVFPDSKKAMDDGLGHLPADIRNKIVCENAIKAYRFN